MGQVSPLIISEGTKGDVRKASTDGHGDPVPISRKAIGCDTGGVLGGVVDTPAEGLHLARGENSLAIGHMSTLVDDENDMPSISADNTSGLDKGEISDRVIIDAIEVDGGMMLGDDTHVTANDAAIGTVVYEGAPLAGQVSGMDGETIVVYKGVCPMLAIVSGRQHHIPWLAGCPAGMSLCSIAREAWARGPRDKGYSP